MDARVRRATPKCRQASRLAANPRVGTREESDQRFGETLSGLVGTIVIGVGGARVITAEVDKRLLRAAATEAATSSAAPEAATAIATATPAAALQRAAAIPS